MAKLATQARSTSGAVVLQSPVKMVEAVWCTQLDDVGQDLAVSGTEIDMSVDSLQGVSVPQDVILALEEDLCGHLCGSRSPLVTVTPADPNVRARVMGVAEVDNSSDSATVPEPTLLDSQDLSQDQGDHARPNDCI